ncbi:MAG: hypothetical protein LBR98_06485 [Syntrophomonadaceae bacterium]|jgi:hypothetical protein|nr:hypothetical protein [Syntrophomonadaceae bacterium]
MKKKLISVLLICAAAIVAFSFSACSGLKSLDVVGKESITSFSALLDAVGDKVTPDDTNGGWSLSAPDDTARFIWSKDYGKSPLHDVMLELDAQPFIGAGLDTSKLPDNIVFYEGDTMGGMGSKMLMVGTKLGNDELKYSGNPTPLASYEQIVSKYRDVISYHAALDHYGVNLGDGNLFEWAKDMSKNDKDIVFVLNPQAFIDAGVNVNAVEGWAFAKVPVDVDGKPAEVDKLLKPFDLK